MILTAVGLGDMRISRDPDEVLVCYGLGSCIGMAFYDPVLKLGALVHVVLPDSELGRGTEAPGKFADTAVPATLEEMSRFGAVAGRLQVRLAGGARMLQVSGVTHRLDIGARNVEAIRAALQGARLTVTAADTGGNHGRTMSLYIRTGRVVVGTAGRGEREL